jgi:hypothetical protein
MNDTDKYEGHTEGPWYRMHSNDTIRSEPMGDDAEAYLFDIVGATTVDAELAADAPLLLAEVKRLRNEMYDTHTWIEYNLLRVENGTITKNHLIELMMDMCNSPEHKAIVEQKWEGEEE